MRNVNTKKSTDELTTFTQFSFYNSLTLLFQEEKFKIELIEFTIHSHGRLHR